MESAGWCHTDKPDQAASRMLYCGRSDDEPCGTTKVSCICIECIMGKDLISGAHLKESKGLKSVAKTWSHLAGAGQP